eukprot:6072271-Amphidinium_carterae.1
MQSDCVTGGRCKKGAACPASRRLLQIAQKALKPDNSTAQHKQILLNDWGFPVAVVIVNVLGLA